MYIQDTCEIKCLRSFWGHSVCFQFSTTCVSKTASLRAKTYIEIYVILFYVVIKYCLPSWQTERPWASCLCFPVNHINQSLTVPQMWPASNLTLKRSCVSLYCAIMSIGFIPIYISIGKSDCAVRLLCYEFESGCVGFELPWE